MAVVHDLIIEGDRRGRRIDQHRSKLKSYLVCAIVYVSHMTRLRVEDMIANLQANGHVISVIKERAGGCDPEVIQSKDVVCRSEWRWRRGRWRRGVATGCAAY